MTTQSLPAPLCHDRAGFHRPALGRGVNFRNPGGNNQGGRLRGRRNKVKYFFTNRKPIDASDEAVETWDGLLQGEHTVTEPDGSGFVYRFGPMGHTTIFIRRLAGLPEEVA